MCRTFFICADGKKTALVQHNSLPHDNVLSQGGGPLAVEGVEKNLVSCNLFHQYVETCDTNLRKRRYSVIEK